MVDNSELSPADLKEIGDARRVRQWMARERPIPSGVWHDLADLLHQRGEAAIALSGRLKKRIPRVSGDEPIS